MHQHQVLVSSSNSPTTDERVLCDFATWSHTHLFAILVPRNNRSGLVGSGRVMHEVYREVGCISGRPCKSSAAVGSRNGRCSTRSEPEIWTSLSRANKPAPTFASNGLKISGRFRIQIVNALSALLVPTVGDVPLLTRPCSPSVPFAETLVILQTVREGGRKEEGREDVHEFQSQRLERRGSRQLL